MVSAEHASMGLNCLSSNKLAIKGNSEDYMGDKGKRDKGKREEQKKSQQTPKEKRKQKKDKKNK